MIPTPIPPHVIATVFQYILPPSLPIPPHLVSPQLLERHRFLSISPTDIVPYLCWPSHESPEIVRALEGTPHDTWASEPEYHVRYTAPDEETLLAHVRPTEQSPVQVVFSWDGSWKYHDTRLWPLPTSSYASLQEALANISGTRSSSPDSGDYWAGYGSGDDSPRKSSSVNIGDDSEKAEAAYWASYSVVQGSGDSTVPSPRPEKRTQAEHSPSARGPETAFDPFIANLHLRLQRENGRMSGKSSPRSPSPQPVNNIDVDEASLPAEDGSCNGDFPHISKLTLLGERDAWVCTTDGCGKGLPELVPETRGDNQLEQGLKESIRGLYQMWTTGFGTNDKEAFIKIVKDALE